MYTAFEEISDNARIWIYQSDRPFTNDEVVQIETRGKSFAANWEAHGKPLLSSVKVFHHQFVVVAADEGHHMATGCSIDSSVGFIRQIADQCGVDLFNRTNIAFLDNDQVVLHKMKDIKTKVSEGAIKKDSVVFNNLVTNKEAFDKDWRVSAESSWLSKYF